MGKAMKRAAIYLRVSTQDQTTSNQEHELRQAAERADWQVAKVYRDHGISGAKGRNGRPAFDALCRDATKRQFDVVMAWNVDRLGRSLKDLVAFLSELHALGIDLFLHQQGLDTTTPAGKAMFLPSVDLEAPACRGFLSLPVHRWSSGHLFRFCGCAAPFKYHRGSRSGLRQARSLTMRQL